jgi:hypothetical protein
VSWSYLLKRNTLIILFPSLLWHVFRAEATGVRGQIPQASLKNVFFHAPHDQNPSYGPGFIAQICQLLSAKVANEKL